MQPSGRCRLPIRLGPTRLDHQHGFVPRRPPRRRHELAGRVDRLQVEQDRRGRRIAAQVVEHVAGVDVGTVSERDEMREADLVRASPSSTAEQSAPDCETKASLPASASMWAKDAFRPASGTMRPRQLGPRIRSRCGRATSSIRCWSELSPPCVVADMPAARTTTARVPRSPSSSTRSGTVEAGVQITARSGVSGSAATSR